MQITKTLYADISRFNDKTPIFSSIKVQDEAAAVQMGLKIEADVFLIRETPSVIIDGEKFTGQTRPYSQGYVGADSVLTRDELIVHTTQAIHAAQGKDLIAYFSKASLRLRDHEKVRVEAMNAPADSVFVFFEHRGLERNIVIVPLAPDQKVYGRTGQLLWPKTETQAPVSKPGLQP